RRTPQERWMAMDAADLPLALRGRAPASLRHVRSLPARPGQTDPWPDATPPTLIEALGRRGIPAPWRHQVQAALAAQARQNVVVATGTASGKTLAMWLPALTTILTEPEATVLYLAPTKALAHDQANALDSLSLDGLRASTYDGDTPPDERGWVRSHANFVLSNPDLVHRSMLPRHTSWSRFLRNLRFILIDEAHHYRGLFGSHVALVLRRLRRMAADVGADPLVVA
ncbi:MAG: DEAD/DEAH box helicase, partial [Candidatus Nanopelagicales bacterium]